jgi:hypothetical protein
MFGRSRYAKLVDAQLDLFIREHQGVIEKARQRLQVYNRSDRAEAEELYGDYVDAVETATEILADMRDHYGATLADQDEYVAAFNRGVSRRLREFSVRIDNT